MALPVLAIPTILKFLKSDWLKYIIITLAILGSLWLLYDKVYTKGYDKAKYEVTQVYENKERERFNNLSKKIDNISTLSTSLYKELTVEKGLAKSDIAEIVKKYNNKPSTNIPECLPSENFIETKNKIYERANK